MISYLISGATGMIGQMLIKSIMTLPDYSNGKIKLIAVARNVEKLEKLYLGCFNVEICAIDICSEDDVKSIEADVDYIIHCAAITSSYSMISTPVEVADGIVLGTRNILELAKNKNVKSMVYLSSMEVYGQVKDIGRPRTEAEIGDVALDAVRSCYPLAKRMAEHYCYIFAQESKVPVKIARLSQVFGKGVQLEDNRVYMQFVKSVVDNRDIVLKTLGKSKGNYCATDDVINAIFTILNKGVNGEVYNVVNEANTMTIYEMAQLVADKIANGKIKVCIELEDLSITGYAPHTELCLSGEKLRNLGWKPTKDLVQMYKDVLNER